MQTEPRSHVLVALALAAACAAVFLSHGLGADDPLPPPTVKPAAVRTGQDAADPTVVVPAPPRAEAPLPGAAQDYAAELAAALWIEGRVVFPPNTPKGERVVVTARGKRFQHGPQHSATVGPESRFRVAVPAESTRILLALDADHLYLERSVVVRPGESEDETVLEPLLGGRVRGRAVPPDDTAETARALVGATVGIRPGPGSPALEHASAFHAAQLGEQLGFEFRAVPAGALRLSCRPEGLAPAKPLEVDVAAGADCTVELTFPRAVRLAGRAAYADGTPVKRAIVFLRVSSRGSTFPGRTAETDDEGRFAFFGIAPGSVALQVDAEGAPSAAWGPEEMSEGEVVDDLLLTLGGSSHLTGTVRHADGTPPKVAVVTVEAHEADAVATVGSFASIRTDAEGRFTFLRLEGDRFDVHAEAPRGKDTPWIADASDVPKGQDLSLTLSAGLACAGFVLDDLGRPLDAFRVSAWPRDGNSIRSGPSRSFAGVRDGAFELAGLVPGTWVFTAEAQDVRSEMVAVHVPTAERVTLTIPRLATLAGVLLDPGGRPVAGARVELQRRDTDLIDLREAPSRTSDAAGAFAFEREASGPVAVAVNAQGFPPFERQLTLAPGERRDDLRIVLGGSARIVGRVASASGAVSKRVVTLSGDPLAQSLHDLTEEGGEFSFENLAAGTYLLECYPSESERSGVGPGELGERIDRLGLEARVTLADGEVRSILLGAGPTVRIRLHGRVLLGDVPCEGASIRVSRPSRGRSYERRRDVDTQSDAEGHYELTVDGPGEVEIAVRSERIAELRWREVLPDVADVALDLVLQVGRVSGTVRDEDGAPLADVPVHAWSEDGGPTITRTPDAKQRTDARGRYAFEGLRAGSWTLSAGGAAFGFVQHRGVDVPQGAEGVVDFTLARAGTVAGRVTDMEGAPIEHARIYVRCPDGQVVSPAVATLSEEDGSYRVEGLAPGRVTLLACQFDAATREERAVEVRPGVESVVDLVVEPATFVRAHVVDEAGKSVEAVLWLFDRVGRPVAFQKVGSQGADPLLGPLPPGEFTLRAEGAPGRGEVRFSVAGERTSWVEVVVR